MKRARFFTPALLVVLAAAILSCGDPASNGPNAITPQADLLGGLLGTTTSLVKSLGLLKCKATYAQTVQTVGKAGGVIKVGPHQLAIPSGALSQDVTITATAPKAT